MQITAGDAGAADVEFTRHTDRHRLQIRVEQEQRQVGNRAANRASRSTTGVFCRERPVSHMHARFGDAVHIDELRPIVAVPFVPGAQLRGLQRLSAEDHRPERKRLCRVTLGVGFHQLQEG